MEMINGCTIIARPEASDGPVTFGPEETGGAFLAMVGGGEPGQPGPPMHVHPTTDETFFVSHGELTCQLGDRQVHVHPGGMVFIPRGRQHTARASGEETLSGILFISPGDVEHEFVPVDESSSD